MQVHVNHAGHAGVCLQRNQSVIYNLKMYRNSSRVLSYTEFFTLLTSYIAKYSAYYSKTSDKCNILNQNVITSIKPRIKYPI